LAQMMRESLKLYRKTKLLDMLALLDKAQEMTHIKKLLFGLCYTRRSHLFWEGYSFVCSVI